MRRRSRGERTPLNAEINVVSLIDVMMLLMIIFMITAPMMQGGVDISLPKAEAKPLEANSGMAVTITRDGTIYVDDAKYTLGEFRATFRSIASRQAKKGVYVRADQNVPYGKVVVVLGIIKAAGVTNTGLVAEPENVSR